MNRQTIITHALRQIGDTSLTIQAKEWLDDILLEMETVGYFWFLFDNTQTITTSNNTDAYPLPSNYSKGLSIYSSEPRCLIQVPYSQIEEMRAVFAEEGNPRFFAVRGHILEVYPKPVTGSLPFLNLRYFKEITLPTDDTTDLENLVGIRPKWHSYLIDGVVWKGFQYIDDNRQDQARLKWENDLLFMIKDNEDYVTTQEAKLDKSSLTARIGSQEVK